MAVKVILDDVFWWLSTREVRCCRIEELGTDLIELLWVLRIKTVCQAVVRWLLTGELDMQGVEWLF